MWAYTQKGQAEQENNVQLKETEILTKSWRNINNLLTYKLVYLLI